MKNHYLDLDEFRASLLKISLYKQIWTNTYTFFFPNEIVLFLLFSNPCFPMWNHVLWTLSLESLHFSLFPSILSNGSGHWQQRWGVMGEVLGPSQHRATEVLTTRGDLSPLNTRVLGWHLDGLTSISVVNNQGVLVCARLWSCFLTRDLCFLFINF